MPAMNLWLETHNRPLLIGHRGASMHAPENTLAAFQLAMAQGADGIELDVKRCAGGEVVVMHDATVDRTTNGKGAVHEMTLAQLRALDAGAGERVPTLDEVIELTATSSAPFLINIEVTNYSTPLDGLEQCVVNVVKRHNCGARILFSSFNPLGVKRLAGLLPDVPRGLLYAGDMPIFLRDVWLAPFAPHEFRHPDADMVTPEYVARLIALGKRINTWTVNTPEEIARVAQCGVQGIIGDSPATMRKVLSEKC
jgi:glycerophosphoryl diester phosphodiesterase